MNVVNPLENDPDRVYIRPSTVAAVTWPGQRAPLFIDCRGNFGRGEVLSDAGRRRGAYWRDVRQAVDNIRLSESSPIRDTDPSEWPKFFEKLLHAYASRFLPLDRVVTMVPASSMYGPDAEVPANTTMLLYTGRMGCEQGDTLIKPCLSYSRGADWEWGIFESVRPIENVENTNPTTMSGPFDESEWKAQLPKDTLQFQDLKPSSYYRYDDETVRGDLWKALDKATNNLLAYCRQKHAADLEMLASCDEITIKDTEEELIDVNDDEE